MSDITFPIEACLVDYIYNSLGTENFFQLYYSLSGDIKFLNSIKTDDVKSKIAEAYEQSWSEFKEQFENYIASDHSFAGQIFPGQIKSGQEIFNDDGFVISSSDQWIEISYNDKEMQNPEANFMFFKSPSLSGKKSELFKEQNKENLEYKGYRFGIKIDRNEIGLYDYAINQLKAKYIFNFAPDPAYFDSVSGKISAYFDINLLDGIIPGESDYEIIK